MDNEHILQFLHSTVKCRLHKKNILLDEGEFIKKSYFKAVLENKYTVSKYCTIFMEDFFSMWWE